MLVKYHSAHQRDRKPESPEDKESALCAAFALPRDEADDKQKKIPDLRAEKSATSYVSILSFMIKLSF